MTLYYSLSPNSTVYFLREQFMSLYNSLCPKSTVYVPIVQFMSTEYEIFHQIAVNVHIL